jgi:PBSX family phage terminase large subunit
MYQNAIVDSLPTTESGEVVPPSEYCVSIDYGTMNAFASILWSKRGGTWYAEKEYYYSGRTTGVQKTDQEYAEDLDAWIKDVYEDVKAHPVVSLFGGGHSKIRTIIDPSAASFIALLKKSEWCKVIPADNAVLDGIRETAVALQTGKIKILRSLDAWKKEVSGYVWDDTTQDERPVKIDDHLMDSMRYFVKTMRVSAKNRQYASNY